MDEDLIQADSHFAFGKNWAAYAGRITLHEIEEAERGLAKLLGDRLDGHRLLDIGCGSGLHALAALRLGAREVVAMDIDADSVATTRAVLAQWWAGSNWRAEERSVFDLTPETMGGPFDIVYSWGVLHHTGDLHRALATAAKMVAEGGRFAFALYRRIWMDWFWRIEKRWYAHASPAAQGRARAVHRLLFKLGLFVTGRRFEEYVANYRSNRGMHFEHDVHDWLGGWPYESILPHEVEALMQSLGFRSERIFARKGRILGRDPGFFGSGCDEYVYRRGTSACAA